MRILLTLAAIGLALGSARAADAVTVELKEFKFTDGENKPSDPGVAGYGEDDQKLFFYAPATATATVKVADAGDYKLVVEASCDEAMDVKAEMSVKVGDKVIDKAFKLKEADKKGYEFKVTLKKGETKIALAFTNDVYKENEYDRNLYVYSVKLVPVAK